MKTFAGYRPPAPFIYQLYKAEKANKKLSSAPHQPQADLSPAVEPPAALVVRWWWWLVVMVEEDPLLILAFYLSQPPPPTPSLFSIIPQVRLLSREEHCHSCISRMCKKTKGSNSKMGS